VVDFLDPYLRGDAPQQPGKRELRYFTMGEDAWKTTDHWPLEGAGIRQLFFGAEGQLVSQPSDAADGKAEDQYKVDFNVGTGQTTRWSTQMGGTDVYYADRREADKGLLVYNSQPLAQDMEITGVPVVDLFVRSSHPDGGVIAYLEMVAPDGAVTVITEGQLRFLHRKLSKPWSIEDPFGPEHSFLRQDAQPMATDKAERVSFALLPTSIRVPAGYSIRLALAGHDKDTFLRVPAEGEPVWAVQRSKAYPSSLYLPVINSVKGN